MSRRQDLEHLVHLVGQASARVLDGGEGWPGLVEVLTPSGVVTVCIHVGPIGLSHRGRDAVERRFQNPSQNKPVTAAAGAIPLLLGIWEGERRPVVVGMEITEHRLTAATRQSYFVPLHLLLEAEALGWGDHVSDSGEQIVAFHPQLLPVFVEMRAAGVAVPGSQMTSIAAASGLGGVDEGAPPEERARRAASVLVRSAKFASRVISAYGGLCAMCGLNFGLLEGAHILPARVAGSPDEVWNGVALCSNHHAAFDKHRVWIRPSNFDVVLHPDLHREAPLNEACQQFVDTTFKSLRAPDALTAAPRSEMFERRYAFFEGSYNWVD